MKITFNQLDDITLEGVDPKDYPDFCDAHISCCQVNGKPATENEVDYINKTFQEDIQCLAMEDCVSTSDFLN